MSCVDRITVFSIESKVKVKNSILSVRSSTSTLCKMS